MFNNNLKEMKRIVLLLAITVMFLSSNAQKLKQEDVELPVSKEAKKKGMYVNTTLTEDGAIRTFIAYDLKKGEMGIDVITVDASGKLIENSSEMANSEFASKYQITLPDPGTAVNPGKGVKVLRLVSSTGIMGKLKIQEGYFEPKYATSTDYGPYLTTYTSVLRGYKFEDEKTTESDMRLNIYAAHCKDGDDLEKSYAILEGLIPNTIGYYNKNATIAFIGKDARIPDKNATNGANVVISGQFDGNSGSFINLKENVLKYNQAPVTSGFDGKGNRSVLVSTLNSPSSSAALNQWQAKGKPYMTYMTMDTEGNVIDNVTFESNSVRGNFAIYGIEDSHFVFGSINSGHSGYYRFDVGSPSHLQIVKIQKGEVVNTALVSLEEMEAMLITPGGKKGKLKYKDIEFTNFIAAPKGGLMAFAQSAKETYIYHINMDGNLMSVYAMERLPGTHFGVQVLPSGDDIYALYRTQNGTISQGIKKSISNGYGYMKNVNFSRIDELMTFGRVFKINPATKTCSEPVDIMGDVILGQDPMFSGSNGELILPVRDTKRNYKMVVIN